MELTQDRDTQRLPDRLSDLLELALSDLEKVEWDGRYVVRMSTWHTPFDGKCYVCLAGAIIAGTLGEEVEASLAPRHFDRDTEKKLLVLDLLRLGIVWKALEDLGLRRSGNLPSYWNVTSYEDSPSRFKQDLRGLVVLLREVEL